jgi:hypothetical protein
MEKLFRNAQVKTMTAATVKMKATKFLEKTKDAL